MSDDHQPPRPPQVSPTLPPPPDDLTDLWAKGYGQLKLADYYGTSRHYVRLWLKQLGLQRRKGGTAKLPEQNDWPPSDHELRRLIAQFPIREIAIQFGVGFRAVQYWLERYEIPATRGSREDVEGRIERIPPPPKTELSDLYLGEKRNAVDLARHYEVSRQTISKWLNDYQIPRRTDPHVDSPTARNYRQRNRAAIPASSNRAAAPPGSLRDG